MSLKAVISPFNRTVANIGIAQLLTNEPLNTGLFISTLGAHDLKKWSGAVTKSELTTDLGAGDLVDKIDISLRQKKASGAAILPESFYTAGKVLATIPGSPTPTELTEFKDWLELTLKTVTIDEQKQFAAIVFDDLSEFIEDPAYLIELENMIRSYGSVAFIPCDVDTIITEAIISDTTNFFFPKTHEISTGVYETGVEAALLGRVIYQGVGKVDGVAKELALITADKASIVTGDGGDLTPTEAQSWIDKGYNLYTQFASSYNETTGIQNPAGEDFTNIWALLKVAADVAADLNQLRHFNEKLSTSIQDQGTVRGTIVNRMSKLKKGQINPTTKKEEFAVVYDYRVSKVDLDYTLETNQGKFSYIIEVSLFQEGKWFLIDIQGYKDNRLFVAEVV